MTFAKDERAEYFTLIVHLLTSSVTRTKKGYKFVFIYLPSGLWWRSNRNEAYDSGCLVVDLTIINQGRATISKECVNYEL